MRLLVGLLVTALLVGCSASTQGTGLVGKPLPLLRVYGLDGQTQTLEHYRGRPLALFFWASGCARSRQVLGGLSRVLSDPRNSPDAVVVAPSLNPPSRCEEVNEKAKRYPSVVFTCSGNEGYDEAFQALEGDLIPYVLCVSREGTITQVGNSADTISACLREDIPKPEN